MKISAQNWKALEKRAREACKKSYSPYSKFKVGAAVLTDKGIFSGTNVENASYGLTNCAERSAIFSAVSQGARKIFAILVFAPTSEVISPCGACRQVIFEFSKDCVVKSVSKKSKSQVLMIKDLLPAAFSL